MIEELRRVRHLLTAVHDLLQEIAAIEVPGDTSASDDLEEWYRERCATLARAGKASSRESDLIAALLAGYACTHREIRRLRRVYAPSDWTTPGRRPAARSGNARPV
jgi:hypothetical protein